MHSCIYEGTIRHRRFAPVENAFRYRMFMMYLDLSELTFVFDRHPLWSSEKPNVAYFRRRDHLGDASQKLDDCVRDRIAETVGVRPAGPIRLLTHLSYFGYRFNPVSFYYCFDAADENLETVVAEVNNTPWNEQHVYVLPEWMNEGDADKKQYRFEKTFHVSPFMGMQHVYDWHFNTPNAALTVHMNNWENGAHLFDATLVMRRTEISLGSLTRVLAQYPFMTVKVLGTIYWQALKLWWKGAPFFSHPEGQKEHEEVLHG